ncbi:MAG: hypothetical protein MJZ78_05580 [Bacteroidales bacterium]|nr:hypothetical protein [Bacteroidales bacterium]
MRDDVLWRKIARVILLIADEYLSNPSDFRLFTLEEYIDFVIDFIERLNPNIVIERFAGEVPPRFLVSKPWKSLRYDQVLSMIEKRMAERDTWQGRKSGNQVDR